NGFPPRTKRPADETIATRRRDRESPVTQGLVSKSGHSASARRLACAGGKSVNRAIALFHLLASGTPQPELCSDCAAVPSRRVEDERPDLDALARTRIGGRRRVGE